MRTLEDSMLPIKVDGRSERKTRYGLDDERMIRHLTQCGTEKNWSLTLLYTIQWTSNDGDDLEEIASNFLERLNSPSGKDSFVSD